MTEVDMLTSDIDALERRVAAMERNAHDRALAVITELSKLTVARGDTIVVTLPRNSTNEAAVRAREAVQDITGHTQVLVISEDVRLSVAEAAS